MGGYSASGGEWVDIVLLVMIEIVFLAMGKPILFPFHAQDAFWQTKSSFFKNRMLFLALSMFSALFRQTKFSIFKNWMLFLALFIFTVHFRQTKSSFFKNRMLFSSFFKN